MLPEIFFYVLESTGKKDIIQNGENTHFWGKKHYKGNVFINL